MIRAWVLVAVSMVLVLLLIENRNLRNRIREIEILAIRGEWPPKKLVKPPQGPK